MQRKTCHLHPQLYPQGRQALYVPFDIPYDAISDKFDVAELNNFHQYDDNNDGMWVIVKNNAN